MARDVPTLDIRTRQEWRTWLEKNYAASTGIWLVFHKRHTGVAAIPYEDAVREALCFGWVDSLIKRLDDDRYVRKFTPRTPTSAWSAINRRRWAELRDAGLLAPPGAAASPAGKRLAAPPAVPGLPAYIARALKSNAKAWKFFQQLAPTYRRHFLMWIHSAKRPETREKRIRGAIALLAAGKKLGLK
jgi:uncharacterized protein YdeI (YjbR/CyaY-like superfamily)